MELLQFSVPFNGIPSEVFVKAKIPGGRDGHGQVFGGVDPCSNHIKEDNVMVTISLLKEMRVIYVMLVLLTRVEGMKVMILVMGWLVGTT